MSFSNWKYDACYFNQQVAANASIFNYVTDNSMYVNKNECNNFTPPFLAYIPSGIPEKSVEIENDLKGINRQMTHCNDLKFNPEQAAQHDTSHLKRKECAKEYNPVPNGYLPKTNCPPKKQQPAKK